MTDLTALLARLEAHPEGGRELDGDIATAINLMLSSDYSYADWRAYCARNPSLGNHLYDDVPRYTTSTDAAVTLVPADHEWSLTSWSNGDMISGKPRARVFTGRFDFKWCRAATPALALCVAALRARQAVEGT